MSGIKEKILSRGYWLVIIRPSRFIEKRISDIVELHPIIQKNSVRMRGWDFPHINMHISPIVDIDWIGENTEWEQYLSSWRFYQSGQFIHLSGLSFDWRDQSSFWTIDDNWKPNKYLGAGEVIFQYTEIMEFATRLALSDAGDESMYIGVKTGNLKGRYLYRDDKRKWVFFQEYVASINEFPFIIECSRSELIADSRAIAVNASVELFKRFGWNVSEEEIKSWQEQMLKRR